MEIQIEEALNLNLGSPALQYKVMPAKLGNGRKGFVAFYSACYDVDVHYSMFVVPSDTLHGIAFDEHGEVLWKKELGIWPSAALYCFTLIDMDQDGIDEIYIVNNSDPIHPLWVEAYVLERMDEMLYYEYRAIMSMLKDAVDAMIVFQDAESGMFWQVIDKAGVEGNYLETSGSALFAYAVLKGVRLGYLPKRMAAWAEKAFYGTCDKYLSKNPDGSLQLDGICLVAGLGGKDHRDGSLAYYFSEPVVCNDAKGVGPLVLAYTEMIARK